MAEPETPRPEGDFFAPGQKVTGVVGALAGLALFGLVLLIMFVTRQPPAPAPKGPDGRPSQEVLQEVKALHEKELTTYEWVDKEKGVVRIPVARAMELMLAQPPKPPAAAGEEKRP